MEPWEDNNHTTMEWNTSSGIEFSASDETIQDESAVMVFHKGFPIAFEIVLHILYNLVLFCGVLGNALVLYVIYSVPRMRTTTNILLTNLAVGDLIIASFCIPFTYLSIVYNYWPFGLILCKMVSSFNAIGVLVSAFTLIALAVERYMAIIHPLAPRFRKSTVVWIIVIIWTSAFVVVSPIAWVVEVREEPNGNVSTLPICQEYGWGNAEQEMYYSLSLMIIQYFVPLVFLLFTYSRITYVVWGIQHERSSSTTSSFISNGQGAVALNRNSNSKADKKSRKAILLTFGVISGYTLAWLPYNIDYIISRYSPEQRNIYVSIGCHWLAMSHCFYNPLIYAWFNMNFRNAFQDVVWKICCLSNNDRMLMARNSTISTSMSSTARFRSYRKISFAPEPAYTMQSKSINCKAQASMKKGMAA